MKDISRFFCDPLKIIKVIFLILLVCVISCYVWVQIAHGFSSDIETQPAILVEVNKTIDSKAYIFRDETVISVPEGGAAVTLVSDSKRVYNGQKIANIYSDASDVSLQDSITRIQRKIDVLEKSKLESKSSVSDLSKIDDDIEETLSRIYLLSSKGDLSGVVLDSEALLVKLNRRNHIVDSDSDYTPEYNRLVSQRETLERQISSVSTPIYAKSSGYFYNQVDGYEEAFDFDKIDNMTLADFESIINAEQNEGSLTHTTGKIVNDFVWFLACNINSADLGGLEEGKYYKIFFPENNDLAINMEMYRIISETSAKNAVCILRSNVIPTEFSYKRMQKAEIIIDECTGLTVPKSALRVVNGVKGVYVLVGDVVHFRRVEILMEKDGYYIVSNDPKNYVFEDEYEQENIPRISLYDNVIVAGKELFEGKIIG